MELYFDWLPVELLDIISIYIEDKNGITSFSDFYKINYEKLFILRYSITKPITFIYKMNNYDWKKLYLNILEDTYLNKMDMLDVYYNKTNIYWSTKRGTVCRSKNSNKVTSCKFRKFNKSTALIIAFLMITGEFDEGGSRVFMKYWRYKFDINRLQTYVWFETLDANWKYMDYGIFCGALDYIKKDDIRKLDESRLKNYFSLLIKENFKLLAWTNRQLGLILRLSPVNYENDKLTSIKLIEIYIESRRKYNIFNDPKVISWINNDIKFVRFLFDILTNLKFDRSSITCIFQLIIYNYKDCSKSKIILDYLIENCTLIESYNSYIKHYIYRYSFAYLYKILIVLANAYYDIEASIKMKDEIKLFIYDKTLTGKIKMIIKLMTDDIDEEFVKQMPDDDVIEICKMIENVEGSFEKILQILG